MRELQFQLERTYSVPTAIMPPRRRLVKPAKVFD